MEYEGNILESHIIRDVELLAIVELSVKSACESCVRCVEFVRSQLEDSSVIQTFPFDNSWHVQCCAY